jgi:hypothetical protein
MGEQVAKDMIAVRIAPDTRRAAAVTAAGGLGIIGGGYGDGDWLDRDFAAAGNSRVGCGFITCHWLNSRNC